MADGPVVEVDGHCVIPMPLYGRSVDRPFKFRNGTKKLRKQRLQRRWPDVDLPVKPFDGDLPFEPVMVEHQLADLAQRWTLLQQCNIDPTVHPVWRFKGGEQAALARWQSFKEKGLNGYARRRNNAADTDGVSRMSAYIHYGMISPMKIARESAELGTKSADKYLDELLVFREHAWHHIYASENPYGSHNLPEWARLSWRSTKDDPRTTRYSLRQLQRADVHDPLWAACQRSLLRHGELHNNVRMTWGKALTLWTEDVEQSLAYGQALNDMYALDGRDPSSVVGVQWCHGLFDRPFHPPAPILGLVRQRDPRTHMSRLDMNAYRAFTDRPAGETAHPIVVIGAGLAGAISARILADHGYDVVVLDKGRRVGGRCSRRRIDDVTLTHGASQLDHWPSWMTSWADVELEHQRVAHANNGHRLLDGPGTVGHWLEGIDVMTSTTVSRIERDGDTWRIFSEDGHQWQASGIIATAPLPQLHPMLPEAPDAWSSSTYEPTWTLVIAHPKPPSANLLNRMASLGLKVEHPNHEQGMVVHFPTEWSREHLELERVEVIQAFMGMLGKDDLDSSWVKAASIQAQRWRYGRAVKPGKSANLPHFVEAGDAWGEPIGTGGGAMHSGAWAAAHIAWQCSQHLQPTKEPVQQTLF